MPQTQLARAQRTGRIVQVLVRHGLFALFDALRSGDRSAAERFGRRLARALDDLGPTFVKVGQVLSTRQDLVPAAVATQLAALQDGSAPISGAAARKQIERSLGKPIHELFARFETTPLATGSIAQVHRAETFSGEQVAVKVRRPGIERVIDADLKLLIAACHTLQSRIPELRQHDAVALAEELATSLRAELDLEREARAIERMRRALGSDGRVPRVFADLSSREVLTLEYVGGTKLADLRGPAPRREAAQRLVGSFAAQLLAGDVFHADPHAGNLIDGGDGTLVLLDLGAVGELNAETRRVLRRFAWAAVRSDADGVALADLEFTHAPEDLDPERYRQQARAALQPLLDRPLSEIDVPTMVKDLLAIARSHGLRVRSEYYLLFRALTLVDGTLRDLDPTLDPVQATTRHIVSRWYRPRWFLAALTLLWVGTMRRASGALRLLGSR